MTACALASALALSVGPGTAAAAPECEPYCNDATSRTANRIDGRGHGAWLATVLDQYGYEGRRWAEITYVPAGHGKRSIGVIQVPAGKARQARRALDGWWFAQNGRTFVLPLVSRTDTRGGTGVAFKTAARWTERKLGAGWVVRTP